ncbi:MAG: Hsp20/alpha crystallin family protein [Isosphaeraceae bacterium]|nr:Hsp20/alpha crystallin family protein [Isosphaeraceae bacterium]
MSTEHYSIRVAVGKPAAPGTEPHVGPASEPAQEPRAYLTPPIDIHEGPDGLILEADLPGASENQVRIQLEDNVLTLHATITSPAPEGARPLHEEYHVGDFYRSFILSDEVERSRITAELRNGVLRLLLPKADRAKTRRIEIKS